MNTNEIIKTTAEIMIENFPNIACKIGITYRNIRVGMALVAILDGSNQYFSWYRNIDRRINYTRMDLLMILKDGFEELFYFMAQDLSWVDKREREMQRLKILR